MPNFIDCWRKVHGLSAKHADGSAVLNKHDKRELLEAIAEYKAAGETAQESALLAIRRHLQEADTQLASVRAQFSLAPGGEFSFDGPEGVEDQRARLARERAQTADAPQTESAAFKRWFGDSKVVGADGRPKKAYHATLAWNDKAFTQFNPDSHFGSYGVAAILNESKYGGGHSEAAAPAIMPVYLSIKNPLRVKDQPNEARWRDVVAEAKANGYDGLVYVNEGEGRWLPEGADLESWVAFSPEQVKSASGNRGTFDPSNKDMRFSLSPDERNVRGDYLRDQDGQPLPVWRGFVEGSPLRPSLVTGGIHFSESETYAKEYAQDHQKVLEGRLVQRFLYFRKALDFRELFDQPEITVGDVRDLLRRAKVPETTTLDPGTGVNGYGERWASTIGDLLNQWGTDSDRLDDFNPNADLTDMIGSGLKLLGFDGILFPEHGRGGDLTAVALKDYVIRRNATGVPKDAGAGIKTPLITPSQRPEGQADKGNVSAWQTEETSALTSETEPESSAPVNPSDNAGPSPRFSLSPDDRNARGEELVRERDRLRAAIGSAPDAESRADLQDELGSVEAEIDALIAASRAPRGAGRTNERAVEEPSEPPEATAPVSVSAAVADAARRVSSATQRQGRTAAEWWDDVKKWFRHLAVQVPEIPIFGRMKNDEPAQFAEKFRRGVRLVVPATNAALDKARQAVENVVKPLMDLGRTVTDPNLVAEYNRIGTAIEKERLRGDRMNAERIDKMNARQAELEAQLAANPWWLYQQAILWRDLWWRGSHLKDRWGRAIKLPGGLTSEDALALAQLTQQRIEASPHAEAIREAMTRHYTLMRELHEALQAHGEIIPENMRNPLYFPHQVLDFYTAKIDAVRPTTEEPFRSYLINPVGSEKLVMADYLASVYKHAAEIYAHNAQVDIAERYVQPYDIGPQIQADLEGQAEERGEPRPEPDAYTWEKNIPVGYEAFKPYKLTPLRPELVIDREKLAASLGVELGGGDLMQALNDAGVDAKITPDMIIEAYVKGARDVTWIVPEEIADALTQIQKRMEAARARTIGRALARYTAAPLQKAWKYNVLFNPWNWWRYERNNLISDVLKMAASDPGMFKYMRRARREISAANQMNGRTTPELAAAMKEGVLDTVTAGEAGDLYALKDFEAFQPDGQRRFEALKRLASATTRGSAFREGVFRYAKFLADLERIRRGDRPEYGGAYARDIETLKSPVAKAAEISLKNFGDYSALSPMGQWLRKHLFPFFSWTEVNFRYHANLTRNIVDALRRGDRRGAGRAASAQVIMGGVQAARIAITLGAIRLAFEAWNQWGGQALGLWDDDDELEKGLSAVDRRRLHLVMGRDAKGEVRVEQVADALGDVLQYFGGNEFARLGMEWARGQITLGQWASDAAKQMPVDMVNSFAQSLRHDVKTVYVLASGKNIFPDITNQRKVSRHELAWTILSEMTDRSGVMGLRAMLDKDYYSSQDLGEWAQQQVLGVRRRDPEQWAYFEIRDRAADWFEEKTGKHSAGDWQSPDQVVLRNFRKAVYRGDVPNAVRFYHRALEMGYTSERFRASLQNQDPLATIPDKRNRAEFVAQLNERDRGQLDQALRYYARLAGSRGREAMLFPSRNRAGQPFPPQTERLRALMQQQAEMSDEQAAEFSRQLLRQSTTPARR